MQRFVDNRESIYDMMREILVVCPRCRSCTRISPIGQQDAPVRDYFGARRVVCGACGFTKDWSGRNLAFDWSADPIRDSYFYLPLWLQAPCCGHTLWAYNLRHLELIEGYINAGLREKEKDPQYGWSNTSLTNRLPEWMIVAKHREEALKAITRLKTKCPVT